MCRLYQTLLLFAFTPILVIGQVSERDVKRNTDYIWAEAIGTSVDAARETAMRRIAEEVVVKLEARTEARIGEVNGEVSSSYKSLVSATTGLQLMGVSFVNLRSPRSQYRVLAYISESDLAQSLDAAKTEFVSKLRRAEQIESINPGLAIELYATAVEASAFVVGTVPYESVYWGRVPDGVAFATSRLGELMSQVDIVARRPTLFIDSFGISTIDVVLDFSINGMPARGLGISELGDSEVLIEAIDGSAIVPMFDLPSQALERRSFELHVLRPSSDRANGITSMLTINRRIPIDFSPAINVDIITEVLVDNSVRIDAEVYGLDINQMEWNLGDGTISKEVYLRHSYENDGTYNIQLKINDDSLLTKSTTLKIGDEQTVSIEGFASAQPDSVTNSDAMRSSSTQVLNEDTGFWSELSPEPPSLSQLETFLRNAVRRGIAVYGAERRAFTTLDNVHIVVIDQRENKVISVFPPSGEQRKDIYTGILFTTGLQQEYRSNRFSVLYVEVSE